MAATPALSELLTVSEAAKILRVHAHTVRKLIHSGDLPVVRVGAKILRIPRSDLLKITSGKGAA